MNYTIIIPTYNRPRYLKRILSYYDGYAGNYNIIVADSSSDENKKVNNETISLLSSINVLHIKNYSSDIDPYYKISDALKHVNTEYCVICADDDFVTPNGIKQSIEFLDKNLDFTIAHGRYITFYLNFKTDERKKQQFCWQPIYAYKSITFPDAKSRLNFHFSNYTIPTLYGVHRTDFLKMIFKETTKFTDDYRFGELLPSMLTLIYGKMKRLDVFYAARESIPGSTGQTCKNLSDFITAGTYDEKYAKFRDCLAMHLSKKSQLSTKESENAVDKAMAAYMNRFFINIKLEVKVRQVLKAMKISDDMIRWIGKIYGKLFSFKKRNKTHNVTNSFQIPLDSSSSKYYDDFNNIRNQVLK